MDRPGSRGGYGSAVLRPGSRGGAGMPGGFALVPPGSAMPAQGGIGARPGSSAMRPGTGKMRPPSGQSGAVAAPRNVVDRPVTQQGVAGMRLATSSGGRQVLDRNYFLSELRARLKEIAEANQDMMKKSEDLQASAPQFSRLQKRHAELERQVGKLRGALADMNRVVEDQGAMSAEDILQELPTLQQRNKMDERRLQETIMARNALESQVHEGEANLQAQQRAMQSRIMELPQSARQQYVDLEGEEKLLGAELQRLQARLAAVDESTAAARQDLQGNPLKEKSLALQEELRDLTDKCFDAESEIARLKAPVDEQKGALMGKIRDTNKDTARTEQQIKEALSHIRTLEEQIGKVGGGKAAAAIPAPVPSAHMDPEELHARLEELTQQEYEIGAFFETLPTERERALREMHTRQETIMGSLEAMSRMQQTLQGGSLPSAKEFQELQDELEQRRAQMETAQEARGRLRGVLAAQEADLSRMTNMEEKLNGEIAKCRESIEELQRKLRALPSVDQARAVSREKGALLEQQRAAFGDAEALTAQGAGERWAKHEARLEQLEKSPGHQDLRKLEEKLRAVERRNEETRLKVRKQRADFEFSKDVQAISSKVANLNEAVKVYAKEHQHAAAAY
ncbi:unnamed protein product [Pedinophyceae sp. YPF-701]|nr:unnamed protein product [Pedinophyceae sp. YPF-701]